MSLKNRVRSDFLLPKFRSPVDLDYLFFQFTACLVLLLVVSVSSNVGSAGSVMISGEVGAGNYSYYRLQNESPSRLILKSITGDADLYISDVLEQPTFDFGEHNASSTSCGDDEVDISRDLKRPVFIAVYGHPRYESSKFALRVEAIVDENEPYNYFSIRDEYVYEDSNGKRKPSVKQVVQDESYAYEENNLSSFLLDVLYSIMHFILEVLL